MLAQLVADVMESEEGAQINLDLTGFGDGSCHPVMDAILKGLAEKDIRLGNVQRRSHYRREGVLISGLKSSQKPKKAVKPVYPDEERRQADARRRQHSYEINRLKLRQ